MYEDRGKMIDSRDGRIDDRYDRKPPSHRVQYQEKSSEKRKRQAAPAIHVDAKVQILTMTEYDAMDDVVLSHCRITEVLLA